jgi:hypothetical protein
MIYRVSVGTAVMIGLVFVTSAAAGAGIAANGEYTPTEVVDRMESDMFTADGDLDPNAGGDPPTWLPAADVGPETPQADTAVRRSLIVPMLRFALAVTGAGMAVGVTVADVLGARVTRWVFQLAAAGLLGGYTAYILRRIGVLERFERTA